MSKTYQPAPPEVAERAPSGITVHFKDVGHNRLSWSETLKQLDYNSLLRAVKRRGGILSMHPDFELDDETGTGAIVAGFRTVGTFSWRDA